MKRLILAPLLITLAGLTACVQEDDPEIVTVPAANPDTVVVPADPVVVPVPTPVPGPPGEKGETGEKGDTGETGEKGETGDTTIPVIIEEDDDKPAEGN